MAIVAGENEACVDKALKMLKVEYEVLPAVLDFHMAKMVMFWYIRKITGSTLQGRRR